MSLKWGMCACMHLRIGTVRHGTPGERVGGEDRVYVYLGGVRTRGLAISLHATVPAGPTLVMAWVLCALPEYQYTTKLTTRRCHSSTIIEHRLIAGGALILACIVMCRVRCANAMAELSVRV